MEIIIRFALGLVMDLIMYNIGKFVISVFSLGRARAEGLREMINSDANEKTQLNRQIVIPVLGTTFIGVAVFSLALIFLHKFVR